MSKLTWEQSILWLRSRPDQRELVLACYYDDPLLDAAKRFAASDEWRAVLEILSGNKGRALDIGAGRGISSYALAISGWEVFALEPNPSDLVGTGAIRSLAAQTSLNISVIQSVGENIDVADGTVDLVYGREVLHHAGNLLLMCKQIARVLKPGGVFLACREHVIRDKGDLPQFLMQHPLHQLYGGENAFMLKEYLNAIALSGLKIRRVLRYYETPINFFPLTTEQRMYAIQAPLRKLLGSRITTLIAAPRRPWNHALDTFLSRYVSWRRYFPGILYTFVAHKPGIGEFA